jgi:putative transposase
MSRPLRIQYFGAVYHVMNRGAARQPTFVDDADYQAFLNTLTEAHRRWGIEVFAYSLMKNHYHLCLRTPKGNLARVMRHIDGIYTQRFNRHHRRDGSLFRGRYKAIVVDEDQYLSGVVRYIHLNPLEARMVQSPEAYPWSSHRYYLAGRERPAWLETKEVLAQLGGHRKTFHEFVLSGNEEALERFYRSGRQSPVLGGQEFIERLRKQMRKLTSEHPRYERRGIQASPEQVIERVAQWYNVARADVFRGRRGKDNEARRVAMYLVTRCCDQTLMETARIFGVGSYGSVGWSCHGVQLKMEKDKGFRAQIDRLFNDICQQKI